MAGSQDPLVEQVLTRFHAHHVKAAITRLNDENARLKRRLVRALACIRLYATGAADGGSHAKAELGSLGPA